MLNSYIIFNYIHDDPACFTVPRVVWETVCYRFWNWTLCFSCVCFKVSLVDQQMPILLRASPKTFGLRLETYLTMTLQFISWVLTLAPWSCL